MLLVLSLMNTVNKIFQMYLFYICMRVMILPLKTTINYPLIQGRGVFKCDHKSSLRIIFDHEKEKLLLCVLAWLIYTGSIRNLN